LGGLNEGTLEKFLSENGRISKIMLALDNDTPDRIATERISATYSGRLKVVDFPLSEVKDWNEILVRKMSA
jgi:hypothetical protein